MKALIQRVKQASVQVDEQIVGQIDVGILAYIGIDCDDDFTKACKLVDKILTYRIFENTTDENKRAKMDKSVIDVGGGLLLVSQFTLVANTNKGKRPDFSDAMPPKQAGELFERLIKYARCRYDKVATGQFGANMQVTAHNDGPINFILQV